MHVCGNDQIAEVLHSGVDMRKFCQIEESPSRANSAEIQPWGILISPGRAGGNVRDENRSPR